MQYGPFTPQECETAISWLKKHNVQFEISKDQDKENDFKASNGANIIKQAEFRTETFLAQLFYIDIAEISEELNKEFNSLFAVQSEIFPKSLIEKSESLDFGSDIIKSAKTKRFWATVLILIWAIFFFGYYFSSK